MIIKKICLSVVACACLNSVAASAQESEKSPTQHPSGWYVGVYKTFHNSTKFTLDSSSATENAGPQYGASVGYDFALTSNFVLGAEAEYRELGSEVYSQLIKIRTDGYSFNLIPKYYLTDHWFVGALIGYGYYQVIAKVPLLSIEEKVSHSAIQFGAETGWRWDNGISAVVGYRYIPLSEDETGLDYTSVTAGLRYQF